MKVDTRPYVVIIGDVSGSKQLSGRNRYQTQLFMKSAIVQINEQFHQQLEAPLTISKGDEFQGLLSSLDDAFRIVLALEKLSFPVRLRFGLGIGRIFRMGGKLPIEMDGPAFHNASNALSFAKKKRCCYCIMSNDETLDVLSNTIFELMTAIKQRWNERHYKVYWSYQDLGTYREVARVENISPQAVCDMIKNIRGNHVRRAEESLLKYFGSYSLNNHHSASPSFGDREEAVL